MKRKKIISVWEFRLLRKIKGAHLKRPQIHFGDCFDKPSEYWSLSDTCVIEIRDWLSRYINEFIEQKPGSEILKASRVHANRIIKNVNKMETILSEHPQPSEGEHE